MATQSRSGERGRPRIYDLPFVRAEAAAFLEYVNAHEDCYFIEEFIVTRDYHPNRWGEWKKEHASDEEFSGSVKKGEMILETRLRKQGLASKTNATMTIFLLANNYGYSRTDRGRDEEGGEGSGDLATVFAQMVNSSRPRTGTPGNNGAVLQPGET